MTVFAGVGLLALAACGGDSNEPNNPFPDAAGVYNVSGSFDDIPSSDAHFEGTLTLTQATRETGALAGSAAILATVGTDIFNLNDPTLDAAAVSTNGVIQYTMSNGGSTWTFSGTLSGNSITGGRHTLSDGSQSLSGAWTANRASSANVQADASRSAHGFEALMAHLKNFADR
jgi:hypothetical protein